MDISAHLHFNSLADAIAFLTAGEKAAPESAQFNLVMDESTKLRRPETAFDMNALKTLPEFVGSQPEEKKGKGKKAAASESAAPADVPSAAKDPAAASTQEPALTVVSSKLVTYADSDLPGRIMKVVETSKTSGDKTQLDGLKALLAEFGVKSGKELTPEQVAEFGPKLVAIEAAEIEDLG